VRDSHRPEWLQGVAQLATLVLFLLPGTDGPKGDGEDLRQTDDRSSRNARRIAGRRIPDAFARFRARRSGPVRALRGRVPTSLAVVVELQLGGGAA
jgi:hypothetical protein